MKRRGWMLMAALTTVAFCTFAQTGSIERLTESEEVKHASVGIVVKSVKDGKLVADFNGNKSLQPASVCKLLATAFALKEKGNDFRYMTSVYTTAPVVNGILPGDIIVKAQGDPCLDSRYFPESKFTDRITDRVKQSGITRMEGQIRVEEEEKEAAVPGSWLWEDVSNYYASVCHGFNYRDNTYLLSFRTGKAGEKAELIAVEPELPGIHFINQVKAAPENADNAWIYGGPYSGQMYIRGTLPQNRRIFRIKGAIHRPDLCFREELRKKLEETGVKVEQKELPEKQQTLMLTCTSPALQEIVRMTNKKSINLFAEALGKLVDAEDYPARCRELLEEAGISSSGVILKDACGLSVNNAVPAEVFTDLLIWAHRELGRSFINSLPLAGTDAGLNAYCKAAPALKNRLRAKTGSFAGVRCLAGYLTAYNGEIFAFTILVNHFDCSPAQLQQKIGEYIESLL